MPFVVFCLNQERRTDTCSGTNNGFSSVNRSTVNQVLSFFPTTNPLPPTPAFCFFLQLASWNLQLSFYKRLANSKNEEQILALERRTDYLRRAENRRTVNQVLSFFPTTNPLRPTPAFCFFLQLASWNLQLSFYKRTAALNRQACYVTI